MNSQLEKLNKLEGLLTQNKFPQTEAPDVVEMGNTRLVGLANLVMNECILSFQKIVKQNGNDDQFQKAISDSIEKFDKSDIYIDTEDKEIICRYFEKLMDVVELESSGGLLNKWLYGFDPAGESQMNGPNLN